MYCSVMWYNSTKTAMNKLKIAYNNCLRRLLGIPKYNSASQMFVNLNIASFYELIRKYNFSFMSHVSLSTNVYVIAVYDSTIPLHSTIWAWWYTTLTVH